MMYLTTTVETTSLMIPWEKGEYTTPHFKRMPTPLFVEQCKRSIPLGNVYKPTALEILSHTPYPITGACAAGEEEAGSSTTSKHQSHVCRGKWLACSRVMQNNQ